MAEPKTAEAEELMSAYLDEQLAPEEAARVEKLLAESPEAREELSGLQSMLKLVKGLPEVEAPPDFYEKVAKKIRRKRLLGGEGLWLLALPFQVLSVVLILVVAVTYMLLHLDADPSGQLEKDPTVQPPQPPAGPAADPGHPAAPR
jgi:anti-sigma factor RsiW